MAKSAEKPVTLDSLATDVRSLTKMVESGFADVRAELSKKADKADIAGLRTDIESLQNDLGRLAKATKLGFDEVGDKFEKVETRFDGVDQKLSNLDNRLDIFVTHEKRLMKVEKVVGLAV
ncbi:MAG: hypothetical protein HYT46_01400 [Candidatus Vogelbacteria bacterium]|nr:hypothetical protein [Candidatus Vogelbacteria bacterium]